MIYGFRLALVLVYGLLLNPVAIGGPHADSGMLVWLPFFLADLPWSVWFDSFEYPSNFVALAVYAIVVGLPWILYGIVFSRFATWCMRR